MKRTIAIKLTVSEEEHQTLLELQKAFVEACNSIAKVADEKKEKNRIRLHHLTYYFLRREIPSLGSQMTCNAVAKVAFAYKALKRKKEISFRENASVHFDKRTYSLKGNILSLFTLQGRKRFQLQVAPFQQAYLNQSQVKEAELVRKGKRWFFHLVLELSEIPVRSPGKKIAIDFGENTIAAISTGKLFGGGKLKAERDKFLAHRKRLQSNGSQAAKKRLRQISGRERRHVTYVNHCVAKEIVQEASMHGCSTIVLEDLKNIRERIQAGKKLRCRLHRWSFDQLRRFVAYKAQAKGIGVVYVNPAYTSLTCASCLYIGKRYKHRFECSHCGSLEHSDLNASRNLLRLGLSAERSTGIVNCRHVAA